MNELLVEATDVLEGLWPPAAIRELAEDGIPTVAADGMPEIVSRTCGEVLWRGGTVPWMLAIWLSAKKLRSK